MDGYVWGRRRGSRKRKGPEEEKEDNYHQNVQESGDLLALLKACVKRKDLHTGSKLHADIVKRGLLEKSIYIGNVLVTLYAKCGALAKAQEVFDELRVWDVVSWNALIAGYTQHGLSKEALKCLGRMQSEGFPPSAATFVCSLKACANIGAVDKGKDLHAEIVRQRLLEKDVSVGTALVDMYAKCGALAKAQEVFDELGLRNIVSWNALITGYAQHSHGEEALNCYERMQHEGISPNAVTFVCVLKACGSIGAVDKGKDVHAKIAREGLLEKNFLVGTTLVDMYAKCGAPEKAQEVFDKLQVRDVVSWTALILGYAQHGNGEEALKCFKQMQREGFSPNAVTFVSILKACGSLAAVDKGKEVHKEIVRLGLLEKNILVGTALVDMYAKCGAISKAQEAFDELQARDVVSWNALITGYGQLGKDDMVFDSFDKMTGEGIEPNLVTFTIVLNACSHSGLLERGQMYFETMSTGYGIMPTLEHYTCMVDLFGRASQFDKIIALIQKMPTSKYLPLWSALLGACRKWGNVRLGRLAFDHAVELDEKDPAAYVCMSNIYTVAAMQGDADKIEAMRVKNEAWDKLGCCWWTDVNGLVHSFSDGDKKHSQIKSIYSKLEDLAEKITQEGHSQGLQRMLQDNSNDTEQYVQVHSVKLAIICALINTPQGASIHVVKNMQVCDNCHSAILLISKVEERKIVVRDAYVFHIFAHGRCTCEEYCLE